MFSLAPPAKAGVEGCIETNIFKESFDWLMRFGLDMWPLLDQRIAFEINPEVASSFPVLYMHST